MRFTAIEETKGCGKFSSEVPVNQLGLVTSIAFRIHLLAPLCR